MGPSSKRGEIQCVELKGMTATISGIQIQFLPVGTEFDN